MGLTRTEIREKSKLTETPILFWVFRRRLHLLETKAHARFSSFVLVLVSGGARNL